jgi:hypothetical protein
MYLYRTRLLGDAGADSFHGRIAEWFFCPGNFHPLVYSHLSSGWLSVAPKIGNYGASPFNTDVLNRCLQIVLDASLAPMSAWTFLIRVQQVVARARGAVSRRLSLYYHI